MLVQSLAFLRLRRLILQAVSVDVQHPRIGDGGSSHAQTAGQSPEDTALQTLLMKLLPGLLRLLQPFIQRPRQDCSGLPDPFAGACTLRMYICSAQ